MSRFSSQIRITKMCLEHESYSGKKILEILNYNTKGMQMLKMKNKYIFRKLRPLILQKIPRETWVVAI